MFGRPPRILAERDRTLGLLLDTAPQGVALVDAPGTIVTANRALEALFGWEPGTVVGQSIEQLVPPSLRSAHRAHRTRYLDTSGARTVRGLQGYRSDGTIFPVEISLNHVETDAGRHTLAFVTDITDRVRADTAARDSQRRLQLALEAADGAAWSLDTGTSRIEADERHRQCLGIGADEPLSLDRFLAHVHADDRPRVRAAVEAATQPGGPTDWNLEHRLVSSDGRTLWCHNVARAERDAAGRCLRIAGTSLNVTARTPTPCTKYSGDRSSPSSPARPTNGPRSCARPLR